MITNLGSFVLSEPGRYIAKNGCRLSLSILNRNQNIYLFTFNKYKPALKIINNIKAN